MAIAKARASQSRKGRSSRNAFDLPHSMGVNNNNGTSTYGRGASTSSLRTRRSHRSRPTTTQGNPPQC
jgi:hypothetical protein